jgi:uncharacterized protein with ParB-like and HNH nuclease domain
VSRQKYAVNQHLISTLLSWVKSGDIAIPEIQRPFVWDATKVRDLMDSLYQGYTARSLFKLMTINRNQLPPVGGIALRNAFCPRFPGLINFSSGNGNAFRKALIDLIDGLHQESIFRR